MQCDVERDENEYTLIESSCSSNILCIFKNSSHAHLQIAQSCKSIHCRGSKKPQRWMTTIRLVELPMVLFISTSNYAFSNTNY